jgi:MinD superfamily P-loop ATPase
MTPMAGMSIAIASGKGGTGKTTFALNLAYALSDRGDSVRLIDCDVEAPNAHLFVKPVFTEETAVTVLKPKWDGDTCVGCGRCVSACNFNALALVKDQVLIFGELCHACGACSYVCPCGALTESEVTVGRVQADTRHPRLYFARGILNIGEVLAPTVVRAAKTHTDESAINIIDASPGVACSVVEALTGADVAVLVTDPTPFGLHDLRLAVAVTTEMGIPTGVVINRSDGTDELIRRYAEHVGVPIIGTIPFRRAYAESYSRGQILAEVHPELCTNLVSMFEQIRALKAAPVAAPVGLPVREQIPEVAEAGLLASGDPSMVMGGIGPREIVIVSGKGGTGKTTVAGAFAVFQQDGVLADTDVDTSNLPLLFQPQLRETHSFTGGLKATVNPALCSGCGACAEVCRFDAIALTGPANRTVGTTYHIEPYGCEGCGLCAIACPQDAIEVKEVLTGHWYVSATGYGPMVHARLRFGQEGSGKLVMQVRGRAANLARDSGRNQVLLDGPPGNGCPVIASITGADLALIVTEPTVSGIHDMERVLDLASHFGVPTLVLINKADLNLEQADRIERIANERGVRVIARVPFDMAVHDALMAGKSIAFGRGSPAAEALRDAWNEVRSILMGDQADPQRRVAVKIQ